MPPKTKPDYDIDALFEGIESNAPPTGTPSKSPLPSSTNTTTQGKSEKDLLAELDSLAVERRTSTSRPTTPRIRAQGTSSSPVRRSIEKSRTGPRGPGEGYGINTGTARRDSGDIGSKAGTPIEAPIVNVTSPAGSITTEASGGSWWGSVWSTASAAVKTAEGVYKELQNSEEAKKWTEQVKSVANVANVDTIQKLGGELRSRAFPTLSNILHTIAPPISSHEQLRIHITHDIVNYPSIDTIVYGVFDRVMQQVEGGELLVVQRGGESKPRRSSGGLDFNSGPWYKGSEKRALNACVGFEEGTKLAKAAAEGYAQEHLQKHSKEEQIYNPENPTRKSDIFLAIQPLHFSKTPTQKAEGSVEEDSENNPETLVTFALYLYDPVHNISFATTSQSLPFQWLEWIDSSSGGKIPDDIAPVVNAGGIDPREWVVEWIEEALGLAIGILAQRYIAKRMNIGEGDREEGNEIQGKIELLNKDSLAIGEERGYH